MEAKEYVKYNEDQYRFKDIGDKRDSGRKQSIKKIKHDRIFNIYGTA